MNLGLTPHRRSQLGLTLIEVMIAFAVLSTMIMGISSLFITTERMSIISREEAIAMYAAEAVINEIRSMPFSRRGNSSQKIVADYNNETRPVTLDGPSATKQRLGMGKVGALPGASLGDGFKVDNEMGILLINQESPRESDFGDVDGDGDRDFPVDLNLNGSFNDVLSAPGTGQTFPMNLGGDKYKCDQTIPMDLLRLVPIAVILRWNSMAHLERRIQILTFIADRSGNY